MTDNERKELLSKAKPILFNTEMVRAILDGRKTVTRRVVPEKLLDKYCDYDDWCNVVMPQDIPCTRSYEKDFFMAKAPYHSGDILYVRETWQVQSGHRYDADFKINYKAGLENGELTRIYFSNGCTDNPDRADFDEFARKWAYRDGWIPSIHMPKEVARIFLRVTNVRVERLQDCGNMQAKDEGCNCCSQFARIWNSTIKKSDLAKYGWAANPFVWVIEFERIEEK